MEVSITIDNVRLKSKLKSNPVLFFTRKCFFYTNIGLTQSHSGILGDFEGFVQLIPGSNRSDKPINITGFDKTPLNCDCINGSIVNGVREPILYSFGLHKPPGQKHTKNLDSDFLKM